MSETMPTGNNMEVNERVSALESSVRAIGGELGEIRDSLKSIQTSLAQTRETNWPVLIAVIGLCGALWAAAIRPVQVDQDRERLKAAELASAVVEQNKAVATLKTDVVKMQSEQKLHDDDLREIYNRGSPITDKRLTLLEFRINQLTKEKP